MGSLHKLIFIHGWGTSSVVWKNQIDYFSKKYKVETPDLPDHGRNGQLSIVNGLSSIDYRPSTTLIGWSYGGMLSIEMAVKNPSQVKALVLVGCTAKFVDEDIGLKPTIIKNLRRNLKRNFEDTMRNCYGTFFSNEEYGYVDKFIHEQIMPGKKAAISLLDQLTNLDLREILKDINMPTLIVHGNKDEICPIQAGEFLYKHIKGSPECRKFFGVASGSPALTGERFKVIEGAGHVPFYTRSDEFNKILEEFMSDVK